MKTIVITGSTSGLGKALAVKFSQNDTILALCGQNKNRLEEVKSICCGRGAKTTHMVLDVTEKANMSKWINEVNDISPIDIVIANAGVSCGTLSNIKDETERNHRVFDINVNGVLNTILPSIELMKKRKKGHLVLISSVAGLGCLSNAAAYSASKACIRIFGNSLKNELERYNIKVSVVCPGFIKTPMTEKNNFKMPFMIDVENAADIIYRGILKGKHSIIFPKRVYMSNRILNILPVSIIQWLQKKVLS